MLEVSLLLAVYLTLVWEFLNITEPVLLASRKTYFAPDISGILF